MSRTMLHNHSVIRALGKTIAGYRAMALLVYPLMLWCAIGNAVAQVADAIDRPALPSQLGPHSALMAAAYAGKQLIVVGERGLILGSTDEGKHWQQRPSPVSVTLTGVSFADAQHGYVIGHGGIVMSTSNAGDSWQVRLNGRQLAQQRLRKAEQSNDKEAIRQAKLLVSDGPDKPFLDLLVLSPDHLIVVGAYGFAFETRDGGRSWQSWMARLDNPFGLHLYSIRKRGSRILIAGEQGFVALSKDAGNTFETIDTPYEGSFFTAQLLADQGIVLAGLRGNAYRSDDNGATWTTIKNPISATITASTIHTNGHLLMVNQAGMLLELQGNRLVPVSRKPLPPLTCVLEKIKGGVLALSIHGPVSIDVGNVK